MPPLVSEDESSNSGANEKDETPVDESAKKKPLKQDPPTEEPPAEEPIDDEEGDDEELKVEEDDEDDEDAEGEFVVEAIKSHLVNDGVIHYHVKWEGYEKRSDMTWEPEGNLVPSAEDILKKYLKSVGGRKAILDENAEKPESKTKKRGRASTATSTPDGKPNGKKPRKNAPHPASTSPPLSLENAAFKPPTGSWEDDVQGIDACEGKDGKVVVFLQWTSGNKTQHPLEQVYKRCPQKMLKFYESHLSFTPATDAPETPTDVLIESSKGGTGRPRGRPRKQKD